MMEDIEKINIDLIGYKKLNISSARQLFVKEVLLLLNMINSNEEIRTHLHKYPFTIQDIFLGILFEDQFNELVEQPYIARVSIINESIYYGTYNKNNGMLTSFYNETFEEALQKIQNNE
jgi:hypothetical protein